MSTLTWSAVLGPDISLIDSNGVVTDLGSVLTRGALDQPSGVAGLDSNSNVTSPVIGDITKATLTINGTVVTLQAFLSALQTNVGSSATTGASGQGFNLRGFWAPDTHYAVDDVVTYNGSSYAAPVAFTSTTTFSASNWQLMAAMGTPGVGGTNGLGFNLRGAWMPNTAYAVDDVVTYSGSTYAANVAFTSGTTFIAANWQLMALAGQAGAQGIAGTNGQGFTLRGTFTASTAYNVDDVVSYNGSSYAATAAFTSTSTFNATNWQLLASAGATGATGAAGTQATTTVSTNLTATGTTLATALTLTASDNFVTTVASGTGVSLLNVTVGQRVLVVNRGQNLLNIWPSSLSDTIENLSAGVEDTLAIGTTALYERDTASHWVRIF